ncbi:MAG TPA: FAD-linked oxidase C-terminal domain-containing protein [Anaerolineales bacterium]|nr:FAD-linked oxidase C-terminal domain-containing protein [Anaerolineales bacterium]
MSLHPDFINELRKHFTGDIRLDSASKILYSTDASIYQIEPFGVAIPRTQDDLQSAVELAAKYAVPILPRGAGSSLDGQAIGEALILDCSRWLDSIIEIDSVSRTATVEPGVVLSTLNAVSARYGLVYGPDPASAERATMGGVIGNNATGAHSILYGMSADHLISADVILGDGTRETWDMSCSSKLSPTIETIRGQYADAIKRNYPRTWRNSAGYRLNYLLPWSPSAPPRWIGDTYPANLKPDTRNLASLLAGSEGTLAVMRRITVNLVQKPMHTILGVLPYKSIADACDDVPRLLAFEPSAVELIPRMILQLARSVPAYERQMGWVAGDPAAVLVIEFSGDQPSALKEAVRKLGGVLTIAETEEEQARIWNVRKMGLGILDARPRTARPLAFIEDCAIPVERLGEFIREVEQIMATHGTQSGIYAHASAGCLHIRPILDLQSGDGVRALRSISEQVFALTMRLGGSMSSEHGDGIATGEWIDKTYGREVTEAMRLLKRAADPNNLLNPNKLFDAPPMDTHLRFGEAYRVQTWIPSLHFEHERGLAGAIEHCNGQGVCLKSGGVMCPSYQATREESNSTRGRANLLRGLIAHPMLRNDELTESVARALDLCLACKGCKAECPSGVDMAKLKYEFENKYYKTHRRPLRDYVFGYFHIVAMLASLVAPLSNAVMGVSFMRNMMARLLGITTKRPFPKFAGRSAKPLVESSERGETVIFLSDPFARYIEPQVEQAAFDVLSACGYDVRVLPIVGAGASLLSKGLIDAAKRHARKVVDALNQIDPRHEAVIVGVEPPEIYTLKNDYPDLLPDRTDEIGSASARTWLLDEYLLRSSKFLDLRVGNMVLKKQSDRVDKKIKFQPHCHQRAEGLAADGLPSGSNATVELLRSCGFEVELLDTGCCGMAGTFGYEVEHYDLSMQVGELKLFPKIREQRSKNRELIVIATGAACRMQIFQGVGMSAQHPIELLGDVILASNR